MMDICLGMSRGYIQGVNWSRQGEGKVREGDEFVIWMMHCVHL